MDKEESFCNSTCDDQMKIKCHTITPVPTIAFPMGIPASILLTCMHSPSPEMLANRS
jgi:hypothetical protein